jgi:hypothetical protein
MWKLIILTSLIWNSLFFEHESFVVLILDDCQNWRAVPNNALKYKSDFIYSKDLSKNQSVSLGHMWYDPKPKPETKTVIYSEIIKMTPIYTSELSYEDWWKLKSQEDHIKIFILKPEDFCSDKRFSFSHAFTLYEVKFSVSANE